MSAVRPDAARLGAARLDAGDLRSRVAAGPLLAVLLRLPSETLVEMAGEAGMDAVVLDLEHGPADLVSLQHHLAAAASYRMHTLVRIGQDEPALLQRCLDLGVSGVVLAHVSSPDDAARAVTGTRYPPYGTRGFASYTRAAGHGSVPAPSHLAAPAPVVIAMIEDPDAVAATSDIVGVDGVDGVLVGPADLAVALGVPPGTGDPRVRAATAAAHAAARDAGGWVMEIVADDTAARRALAEGSSLVLYNLTALIGERLTTLAAVRDQTSSDPTPRGTP